MTDQPEALRVAAELDALALKVCGPDHLPLERVAARLLREQHHEISRLWAVLGPLTKVATALDAVDSAARHVRFVSKNPLDEDAWESLNDALDDVDFVKLFAELQREKQK